MAYLPAQYDPNRPNASPFAPVSGSGSAVGGPASGSAPSAPPPSSDGRFGAMRAFFAANQPAADAQISGITAPIEEKAKEAQTLTTQAGNLYESEGGADAAGKAMTARDEVLGKVKNTASVEGMGGLLGEGKDATYTEGQRNADAYLFGRAPGLNDWRNKWSGILGSLDPKFNAGERSNLPPPKTVPDNAPPRTYPTPDPSPGQVDPVYTPGTGPSGPGNVDPLPIPGNGPGSADPIRRPPPPLRPEQIALNRERARKLGF